MSVGLNGQLNFQPHKAAKRKNKVVQGGATGQYSISAGIVLAGPTPSSAATRQFK